MVAVSLSVVIDPSRLNEPERSMVKLPPSAMKISPTIVPVESSEEFKNCLEVIVENIKSGKTDRNKIKKEAEMFFCFDSAMEKMNNFLLSK